MFGCSRAATAWASTRNRRRNAPSSATAGGSTLTATRRRRLTSSAAKTAADAPVPIGATSRYRPPKTRPTWSAKCDVATAREATGRDRPDRGDPRRYRQNGDAVYTTPTVLSDNPAPAPNDRTKRPPA